MSFTPPRPEWQQALPLGPSPSPPMLSPTSVPSGSSKPSTPERKPKLRASCDACAASKVKCSKEHPICARCSANGSQCIYGVSRKHGKPGRTRKRNPDGTPFIKASKQRPSPDGSEFGKFRVRAEPLIPEQPVLPLNDFSEIDTMSSWSSTPSWPATPEFEFEMTPEPLFLDQPGFPFMEDILMTNAQPMDPMMSHGPTIEPEHLTFRDPFAKKESVQLDLPDIQALKDFIGGELVNPLDYTFDDMNAEPFLSDASTTTSSNPQSPSSAPYINPLRVSISIPTSHCCYTLAYSTLESLSLNPPITQGPGANIELKSLDSVLSITKTAVQNVLKLLSCPCSSDPHLAMLYSSIASKVLTWYQIAAGVNPASPPTPTTAALSTGVPSPSSSAYSSPLSTPSSTTSTFNIQIQPLKIGLFEFDAADQEALRRQVVLRELKKCSTLVEALANWKSDSTAEQAEFLYDVLGAWLKSELYKTLMQVGGEEQQV
ncbi:hypothetical protein BS50DRAFT_573924 [Corynespora cassiicola Philippines]|uniref:Zn(2)-C6 fungal-type domain-containing protein n=1 Tax=Corynespora cassiicola Philippines TaxID=1448308 RepID=A0A2T2NP46_CORCC|nr:hypothetical protein BS50DRAFT_573924 [Corynespora cassiicola Philippines]